jgi:acetoin utilization deacetylase AcuC-like enzyme
VVLVFSDPRCLSHRVHVGYAETPQRLACILDHLAAEGREVRQPGGRRKGAEAAVLRIHDQEYLRRFERAVARGDGLLDSSDNPLSPGTWDAAWAAVETALAAADWVLEEGGRSAFAAVRPPGHHAERDLAMGFCFFNSIAVVAEHMQRHHGLEKVAIVDFDVHHGNGTQHAFEDRGDVLYLSTHQFPFYPGTGAAAERGRGDGEARTVNLPLPAGSGDDTYRQVFAESVLPTLEEFGPDMLLLSAGFDAWKEDPVGGMRVSEHGFFEWSVGLAQLATRICGGRLLSVLEGGYDLSALPTLVNAHLRGLEEGG